MFSRGPGHFIAKVLNTCARACCASIAIPGGFNGHKLPPRAAAHNMILDNYYNFIIVLSLLPLQSLNYS